MRRSTWTAVAVAALVLALLGFTLAACGGGGGGGSSSATPTASGPVTGGTLNVGFDGEPTGLDPAHAWEVESWSIERMVYETFLTYVAKPGDAGAQLAPELATEVPTVANGGISADGKTYTFHLRQGVKFAPPISREMTAQDFKYSFQRMLRESEAPTFFYAGVLGAQDYIDKKVNDVKGFEAPDKYTVKITLSAPDPSFILAMTMPFTSVMPKEWVDQQGKKLIRNPLGTGPFVFDHWTSGQEIVMKRNPNYWQQGRPYLDQIDFTFTANPTTQVLKVERGELDVMGDTIPAADYQRVKADPTWGKYVYDAPQIAWYYVFMNTTVKPFDNIKVRQAVNYAVNTAKIEKILGGQGKALNQIFPDGMPGHDAKATFYAYDVAKAKQMLAEAGFPNGFKTTFYAHNVDPFPKLAQAIQEDLKQVGITADIKLMDRATYWNYITIKKNAVPIGLSDWYMDFPDPSDWIGPLFAKASAVDGGQNSSWWVDPKVEALYQQSSSELDPAKRIAMFTQMQQLLMNDAPIAPLYEPLWNALAGPKVGNFYIHLVWNFNFQDMWKTK
jgi:oligopeptide transport system substrate-binding protein